MNFTRRATALAITAAAVIAVSAPAATAKAKATMDSGYDGNTAHCVTHREVWILGNTNLTRLQVETRWEVVNRGWQTYIPGIGNAWAYESCDRADEWAFAQFVGGTLYQAGVVQNLPT